MVVQKDLRNNINYYWPNNYLMIKMKKLIREIKARNIKIHPNNLNMNKYYKIIQINNFIY